MNNIGCTCIIPFYNEEEKILSVLKTLTKIKQISHIIIVDDGSCDNGAEIVQKYCLHHDHISLISYPNNAGKSYAVYTGLQQVKTLYILLFDADLFHIKKDEIILMIENMKHNKHIDMGILRRISSDWYIKLFYTELILSGQRMLRTKDLKDIFAATSINRYQLEVAINMYMKRQKKLILRYPFSAENTFKHHKRGLRYGWKRDIGMYKDIFSYGGFTSFYKQILLFKPKKFTTYKPQAIHK